MTHYDCIMCNYWISSPFFNPPHHQGSLGTWPTKWTELNRTERNTPEPNWNRIRTETKQNRQSSGNRSSRSVHSSNSPSNHPNLWGSIFNMTDDDGLRRKPAFDASNKSEVQSFRRGPDLVLGSLSVILFKTNHRLYKWMDCKPTPSEHAKYTHKSKMKSKLNLKWHKCTKVTSLVNVLEWHINVSIIKMFIVVCPSNQAPQGVVVGRPKRNDR